MSKNSENLTSETFISRFMQVLNDFSAMDIFSIIGTIITIIAFIITIIQLCKTNNSIKAVKLSLQDIGKSISYQEIFYLSSSLDERMSDLKRIIDFKKYQFATEKFDQISTSINTIFSSLTAADVEVEESLITKIRKDLSSIRNKLEALKSNPKLSSSSPEDNTLDLLTRVGHTRDDISKLKSYIHQVRHLK